MFKLFRNKKGVSPLIATIFLMAFAVGLGAVVMQFSEGLIGVDENTVCSADFQLVITRICTKQNILEFTAENNGKIDIDGIKVLIEDMEGEGTLKKFREVISKDQGISRKIKYSGEIQAVQFIPLVKEGIAKEAKIKECSIRAITFTKDQISSC